MFVNYSQEVRMHVECKRGKGDYAALHATTNTEDKILATVTKNYDGYTLHVPPGVKIVKLIVDSHEAVEVQAPTRRVGSPFLETRQVI